MLPTYADLYAQSVYIGALLYLVIISFAKFSVLCFYRRIFINALNRSTMVLLVLQTMWMITGIFETVFRCRPVQASWNVILPAKCQSFELIVIAAEPFNCALDFIVVALPIKVIRTLQLSLKRKITVSGIFLLGSL